MTTVFNLSFRSQLTNEDRAILSSELGLNLEGEFNNYFNPYRGGEAKGARASHGEISLWLTAKGDPPDVFSLYAYARDDSAPINAESLTVTAHSVVSRIATLVESDDQPPIVHLFVPNRGRPAGTLYRLVCSDPPQFERHHGGAWVRAVPDLYWVLGNRLGTFEVDPGTARLFASQLDEELEADFHDHNAEG